MILLAYVLWLALAIYIGRWVIRRVESGRVTKLAIGWSVGVFTALLPYWDAILGLPVTIDACRNRAGLQTYEDFALPLSSVAEVLDFAPMTACHSCPDILVRGLANEVQVALLPDSKGGTWPETMVSSPGPARYWLSASGDPHCDGYFKFFAPEEKHRRDIWVRNGLTYNENACIAAESIPSISADYVVTLGDKVEQHGIVTLQIREVALTRRSDAARIASLARVVQHPWTAKIFLFGLPPVPQCPSTFSNQRLSNNFSFIDLLNRLAMDESKKGVQQ